MKKILITLVFSSFLFSSPLTDTIKLVKEKKYNQALKNYMKIAQEGMIAKYNIGYMYEKGMGVKKNLSTAVAFYKMSADDGYAPAALLVGNAYLKGIGVQKNLQKAIYYYQISAKGGNKEAIKILKIINKDLQKQKKASLAYLTLRSNVYNDKVYVDGKYVGHTKITLPLSANQPHKIEIKKEGYKSFVKNVVLKPKEKTTIKAVLKK